LYDRADLVFNQVELVSLGPVTNVGPLPLIGLLSCVKLGLLQYLYDLLVVKLLYRQVFEQPDGCSAIIRLR